ncbi:MAG: metallophosphoesterase, partial [Candidatus Aminicenantes bacterium]|nr:metallophosphoesterase [Candidatus Aminicenantes bacterium]
MIFLWAAAFVWLAGLPARAADIPCVFIGVDKVVAVGDLHGDYQNFIKILTGTHLVDQDLHWIGGRIHLVQTGDILDRGSSARRIFDLLIRLEKEAGQAGGKIHVLIGNHEEMALAGISFDYPGFVTVDQFQSFLPDAFVEEKQAQFIKKKTAGLPAGAEPPSISFAEL